MSHRRTSRRELLGGAALVLIAACSSDSKKPATSSAPDTVELPTTTAAPRPSTTTTDPPSTTSASTSTTVAEVKPVMPLTGLPITDIIAAGRPALVVKVDNHPEARPQNGLNEADIVFEENVEQLTRFAMVFQSTVSDPVGPIRSGRTQDVDLLGSFNGPLFAWSGGNRRVTDAIVASDLRQISPTAGGAVFYRSRDRRAPHNLYSRVTDLYTLSPPDASAPKPQFTFRPEAQAPAGEAVAAAKLSMDGGTQIRWEWDPNSKTFLRFTDDLVHKDATNDFQVNTHNVVVLFVDYVPSPADRRSPEAQTEGTGEAWVFTAGVLVKGTWTRTDRLSPFTLTDGAGAVIALTAGRTFVELCRVATAASVPAGADQKSIPYP
jgi:hypothetical protein